LGIGSTLSKIVPSLCHTPVWLMKKTEKVGETWFEAMKEKREQTTFFDNA
jgi:hypothetical protein